MTVQWWMCSHPFCLGEPWCSEWDCCAAAMEPPRKKRKGDSTHRFMMPVSPTKMNEICDGYVPRNTKKATEWALRLFREWRDNRNLVTSTQDQCPSTLLEEPRSDLLNYWLSRFVVDIRREDRQAYPPSSLNNILAGLYRYCRSCCPMGSCCPNFMNRKDPQFRELTGAIQVKFRELREQGVGAVVKHASVVTPAEESIFWERQVIGDHSPVALQRAVFFYVGKVFCLRGGEEQRSLKPSQFVRTTNPDCFTYVENGSKNHSGVNPKQSNKVVPVYACPAQRPRWLVYLLDLYFSKFPTKAKEMDVFYLRPKKQVGSSIDLPWYECAAVGKEKLRTFMESMCRDAGITKKTNHSLRATGASALFHAGVPEKLIRDVTGHRSNALQLYERPTEQQRKQVSEVLVQGREFGKENMPASTSSQSFPPPCNPARCSPWCQHVQFNFLWF